MKANKALALFVILAASILPGCGKNNKDSAAGIPGVGSVVGGIVTALPNNGGGSTSCFQVQGGQQASFTVSGQAQTGVSTFSGTGYLSGGMVGGTQYVRAASCSGQTLLSDCSGDQTILNLNGSQFSAQLVLSQITTMALQGYCIAAVKFTNIGFLSNIPNANAFYGTIQPYVVYGGQLVPLGIYF